MAPNAIIDLDSHFPLEIFKKLIWPFLGRLSMPNVAHLTCLHLLRKVDIPKGVVTDQLDAQDQLTQSPPVASYGQSKSRGGI